MKTSMFVATGIALALVLFLNRPKPTGNCSEPAVQSTPSQSHKAAPDGRVQSASPNKVSRPLLPNDPKPKPSPDSSTDAFHAGQLSPNAAVDTLANPQSNYDQKGKVWKELREIGKLDETITELERRMTIDPRKPEYPAELGLAYLQKCATLQDVREQGMLALQADKLFDVALELDASNWDARFTKAKAMTYWPANMNKGDEIINHFQTLLKQQETQSPQPQFAESYLLLGEQYQKAGRVEDAQSVWERGAKLFPGNEGLKGKLTKFQ